MMRIPAARQKDVRHFDSPEQEAYLNLWRTYDRLRGLEDRLFGEHGLTAQQYNALRLLKAAWPEAIPTLSLQARLVSKAPDITRMLDHLEKEGLIERHRPKDNRRQVVAAITRAGLDKLLALSAEVRRCHQSQLGHLRPDELKTLVKLLAAARRPHESEDSDWK